ncbi:MAG: type II secretion system protein [Epsilonproteobacteria bacterium]|nr:type II secretion system protein [Campylobacterota bacterium]
MKTAFTILELVFVVVVIGILAIVALPRMDSTAVQEAADQILSHIRHTQHLAMIDNMYDNQDQDWYKKRWRIDFRDCSGSTSDKYYVVYRDLNVGGASSAPGKNESAKNPHDGKYLYDDGTCTPDDDESSDVLIGRKFKIDSFSHTGGCDNQYIAFDALGRPFSSTYGSNSTDGIMQSDCNLTFSGRYGSFTITITKETGYAYIAALND